jgi:uncharacterized RDD family membrane protein YckC
MPQPFQEPPLKIRVSPPRPGSRVPAAVLIVAILVLIAFAAMSLH